MRKYMMALAGAGASVVTLVALSAAPAMAATLYTVTNGGTLLEANQLGTSTLSDVTSGQSVSCTSGSADITISNGVNLSGTDVGSNSITDVQYGGCTGPLGITFSVAQVGTWQLNATGVTDSNGNTSGTISNVDAKLSGFLCTAEVKGTAGGSYNNGNGTLTASQDGTLLKVTSASCLGVLNASDTTAYSGKDQLASTPYVQIKSQ